MPNTPIYAWYTPYVEGLELSYVSTTTITLAAGDCSDASRSNIITLADDVVIDITKSGVNGLDTGTIAASTFYAVYAIGDSSSYATSDEENPIPGAGVLSLDFDAPQLPAQYDMYRYVGAILIDGSSHVLSFVQTQHGEDRTMWYDVAINVLTDGTSATYANVSLATAVPKANMEVLVLTALTPTAASDAVNLIPYSSTAAVGYAVLEGAVAGVEVTEVLRLPCSDNADVPYIKYKVTGSVDLGITGYIDSL